MLRNEVINPIHKNRKIFHRNGNLPTHSTKKKPIIQNNTWKQQYYMIKQKIKVIQI